MTNLASAGAAQVLDEANLDRGLWHGRPMSLLAMGLMHLGGSGASEGVADTRGSDLPLAPAHHAPAYCLSVPYLVLDRVVNVWAQGDGVGRDDWHRRDHRWWPSHLRSVWQAGALQIVGQVAAIDGDAARLRFELTAPSDRGWRGALIVRGDDNVFNCTARGQTWANVQSRVEAVGDAAWIARKHARWGLMREFFPYIGLLPQSPDMFRWIDMHFAFAVALGGSGWRTSGDRGDTWQAQREVELAAGQSVAVEIALVSRWDGRAAAPTEADEPMMRHARRALEVSFTDAIAANRRLWERQLAAVPSLTQRWPDRLTRLYHKAWVSVLYNTVPPADLIFLRTTMPIGVCAKIAPSTMPMCPATWENGLSALLLSLVNPELGCQLFQAQFAGMQSDGYMGELPGLPRSTQLPAIEPLIALWLWKRHPQRPWLESIWPAILANLRYKAHHPTWKHHGAWMCRNMAYVHLSAKAARSLARQLDRPDEEQKMIGQMVEDSALGVEAFWDGAMGAYRSNLLPGLSSRLNDAALESSTDAEALLPLACVDDPARQRQLLALVRDQFMSEGGAIRRKPRTLPSGKSGSWDSGSSEGRFTLKESNWMVLAEVLRRLDPDLFVHVRDGTLDLIATDGDFFECYSLDGAGQHNGPGTIFGAFAVIWFMLLSEGKVEGLLPIDQYCTP